MWIVAKWGSLKVPKIKMEKYADFSTLTLACGKKMCETFSMLDETMQPRKSILTGRRVLFVGAGLVIAMGVALAHVDPTQDAKTKPGPKAIVHVSSLPMKKAIKRAIQSEGLDAESQAEINKDIAEAMKEVNAAMKDVNREIAEAMKEVNVDIAEATKEASYVETDGQSVDTPAIRTDVPPIHVHVPAVKVRVPAVHVHIPAMHVKKDGKTVDVPEIKVDVPEIRVDVPDIHVDVPAIHVHVPPIHVKDTHKKKG